MTFNKRSLQSVKRLSRSAGGPSLPLFLPLFILMGCGAINKLYPERKARCKVNCEKSPPDGADGNGQLRESLNLPLESEFWLNATPHTKLSDGELAQLLISNPLIAVSPDDASYGQLGKSFGASLAEIDKRITTGFGIDNETRSKKPAADCYRKLLEQDPTKAGEKLVYQINLGLCFSLGQIQQSLTSNEEPSGTEGAGQPSVNAIAYEDAIRITVPQNQIKFSIESASEPYRLIDFGQSPSKPSLPFNKPAVMPFRVIELNHAQVNGVQVKPQNSRPYYELAWDYVALTSVQGNTGFTIADDTDSESNTLSWSIQGRFIHASGNTRDPNGLRISQAADAVGYVRIVTFEGFTIRFPNPDGGQDGTGGQTPAPASGFSAGTTATLSGSYTVKIPQGQGALEFKVVGLDKPCEVEIFAGTDATQESNSLGITNLCKSGSASPLALNLVGFQALSKTQP